MRLDSCWIKTFAYDLGLSRFICRMAGIISPLSEAQDGPFVSSSVLNFGVSANWLWVVVRMQAFLLNSCFASKSSSCFRFYSLGESLARSNWSSWSDKPSISFLLVSWFKVFRKTNFFVYEKLLTLPRVFDASSLFIVWCEMQSESAFRVRGLLILIKFN